MAVCEINLCDSTHPHTVSHLVGDTTIKMKKNEILTGVYTSMAVGGESKVTEEQSRVKERKNKTENASQEIRKRNEGAFVCSFYKKAL